MEDQSAAESSSPVYEVAGFSGAVLGWLGRSVARWQGTLRYTGSEAFLPVFHGNAPGTLILLWHNRLFPCIGALKHCGMGDRRCYALVSASRDGAQLSSFLRGQGIEPVRGSSSRRGAVAARELLRILKQGHHVAITVDGPRGPCYQSQPGAGLLASMTGAPIMFLSAEVEHCWTLPSWDRFIIPHPFSRVRVMANHYTAGIELDRRALHTLIQQQLGQLTRDTHRMGV